MDFKLQDLMIQQVRTVTMVLPHHHHHHHYTTVCAERPSTGPRKCDNSEWGCCGNGQGMGRVPRPYDYTSFLLLFCVFILILITCYAPFYDTVTRCASRDPLSFLRSHAFTVGALAHNPCDSHNSLRHSTSWRSVLFLYFTSFSRRGALWSLFSHVVSRRTWQVYIGIASGLRQVRSGPTGIHLRHRGSIYVIFTICS